MADFDKYQQVVEKAQSDPDFKEKLLQDPKGTLEAEGFEFPSEVTDVRIVMDTRSTVNFVLPFEREAGDRFFIC